MWTTGGLSNALAWDLGSFIFFGFLIYKAFTTKLFREIILRLLTSPFLEEKKFPERIKNFFIWIAVLIVLFILVGGWTMALIDIIKIFL